MAEVSMYAQLCQVRHQNTVAHQNHRKISGCRKISDGVNFLGEIDLQVAPVTRPRKVPQNNRGLWDKKLWWKLYRLAWKIMMWTCMIKWKPLSRSQPWFHVWCFVVDVWFISCWLMFGFLGPIQRDSFSLWPGFAWLGGEKPSGTFCSPWIEKKRCLKTELTSFNVGPKNSCKYGPITPFIGVQEKQRNTFVLTPFIEVITPITHLKGHL